MNNYYETCISEIKKALEDKDFSKAELMLVEELNMPYCPEIYLNQLLDLKKELPVNWVGHSALFSEASDIEAAFMGDDELVLKAFNSLAAMNLRLISTDLKLWLKADYIADDIKKNIVLLMLEQDFANEVEVVIKGASIFINMATLEHPLNSEAYQKCLKQIHDKLEAYNPSMMMLSEQLLMMEVMQDFPNLKANYDGNEIMDRVSEYLGMDS